MARWARSTSIARNNWSLDAGAFGAKMTYATGRRPRHRDKRIMRMDYRARRLRTTLLLGTAFLVGVAIGPVSGLIASHSVRGLAINAAFAQDTDRANTYRLLTLFGDVFERVRSQYVDPVSDKELVENAVNGMLTGLDPHSSYMNAEQFRAMQVETKGEFGGLGIEVVPENGFFKVISPMDDTPASKAGIKAGDIITGLNGKTTQGLSADDALDQMRGPPNSEVTLTIKREGVDHPLEISMRREVIHIQVVKQRMEPDNIGYVRLTEFTEQADAALKQAVQSLRQQAGGKLKGTGSRSTQQPWWPTGSGRSRLRRFRGSGRDRDHACSPCRGLRVVERQGHRHPRWRTAGCPDQWRFRLRQ